MTLEEFCSVLDSLEIPWACASFTDPQQASTYLVYTREEPNIKRADDSNYYMCERINLELYSATLALEEEKRIEEALISHNLVFNKYPSYIDSERVHQVLYTFELS